MRKLTRENYERIINSVSMKDGNYSGYEISHLIVEVQRIVADGYVSLSDAIKEAKATLQEQKIL